MAVTKQCVCVQCGAQFETIRKRKYCNQRCNWLAAGRRKGKRPRAEAMAARRKNFARQCRECTLAFLPTRVDRHPKGPQVYCSNACARRARFKVATAIAYERDLYQVWSLRAHGLSRAQREWEWKLEQRRARKALFASIIWFVLNPKRECADCGQQIGSRKAERVYCAPCGEARARSQKRASRLARKASEKAAKVEVFDPLEVLERDGWRCHICGIKTPKRLRGTCASNAPELDHIITLAEGGEHSRRNTACACRKCNGMKGSRSLGQLRLVA